MNGTAGEREVAADSQRMPWTRCIHMCVCVCEGRRWEGGYEFNVGSAFAQHPRRPCCERKAASIHALSGRKKMFMRFCGAKHIHTLSGPHGGGSCRTNKPTRRGSVSAGLIPGRVVTQQRAAAAA